MMDISYSGSVLDVDGKSFIFPFDIGEVITDGEYVFVRLSPPMEKKYRHASTNIYGIRDGKVIWQNEDPHLVYKYDYCPFVGIYFEVKLLHNKIGMEAENNEASRMVYPVNLL